MAVIWFQHLRIKLLKDHLEFEKRKREDFVSDIEKVRTAPPSKSPKPIKRKQDRVLIVDDEPWLRDMISMTLKGHDPSLIIEEASDGEEAIRSFELNSPSVLITDIMMPRLDGVKLLKALELLHKTVPTLVISGYATPDSFQQLFLEAGLTENREIKFLTKPFDVKQFLQAVDDLLKSKKD